LITPVASQPPSYPMILYGDILVNDQNAPVDTIIAAYDGNTCIGTMTIKSEGQYGVDSLTNRLAVNEPQSGKIHIYVQTPSMSSSVEANEVIDFRAGDVVRLDLSADVTGSSSGHNLKNIEAMPGGSGVDTGLNQEEAQTSQDTASSSVSDDSSSNKKSNTTLSIAVVIGVIVLIALFYGRSKNMF
jgi:cobalamin biosynthesis Mg chelatase CobN